MIHLTELELSSLGDGEPMNEAARLHLETCEACMAKLGDALLEGDDLRAAMASPEMRAELVPATVPHVWIAITAVLGVLGTFSMLYESNVWLLRGVQVIRAMRQFGPLVAKGLLATAGPTWILLLVVSAALSLLGVWTTRAWVKA